MAWEMTDEEARAWCEETYKSKGYLVFAFRFPRYIGEELQNIADHFLNDVRWRVIGISSRTELAAQLPEGRPPHPGPFYYRCEAMD